MRISLVASMTCRYWVTPIDFKRIRSNSTITITITMELVVLVVVAVFLILNIAMNPVVS